MNLKLKNAFEAELNSALQSTKSRNTIAGWHHLSRAHILGQFYILPHLRVHWFMFLLALKTKNLQEILGQIPRLILAAPGSFFKKAPRGNTGRSNVGIFQPMEIPQDLQKLLIIVMTINFLMSGLEFSFGL